MSCADGRRFPVVCVRPSFYVFWLLFCLLDKQEVLRYFVAAALIHEMGHVLAVYRCGSRVEYVELYAAGVCLYIARTRSYAQDFGIAAAGPVAGLLAAWIGAACGWTSFSGANLLLSLFNLLVICPLDGACMLSALLSMTPMGLYGAEILRIWSVFGSAVLILLGSWVWMRTGANPALFCIGCMLFAGNLGYSCKNSENHI